MPKIAYNRVLSLKIGGKSKKLAEFLSPETLVFWKYVQRASLGEGKMLSKARERDVEQEKYIWCKLEKCKCGGATLACGAIKTTYFLLLPPPLAVSKHENICVTLYYIFENYSHISARSNSKYFNTKPFKWERKYFLADFSFQTAIFQLNSFSTLALKI